MAFVMSNKVYLGRDGIIHIEYAGEQTVETVNEDKKQLEKLIGELHKQDKKAYVLGDLQGLTGQDSRSRKEAFDAFNSLSYDKMALFGMNLLIKYVASFVIKATGRGSKIRLFNFGKEAVEWLKS